MHAYKWYPNMQMTSPRHNIIPSPSPKTIGKSNRRPSEFVSKDPLERLESAFEIQENDEEGEDEVG